MAQNIEAIFFDIGDTLRQRVPDPTLQAHASEELLALVQPTQPPETFFGRLGRGYGEYKKWRQETLIEVTEKELWTQWLLPNDQPERIAPLAERLTNLFRLRGGRAVWRPGAEHVIRELHARRYTLGIISNTISSCETPQALEQADLARYFVVTILSTSFGKRKPDPQVFVHAARVANVPPDRCAYVGDRPSRDVLGCKRAGFALSIVIEGADHPDESEEDFLKPDLAIRELTDLLNIFPARKNK